MSTYVLMRILESSPRRYDAGIRLLTLGRVDAAYDRLANHIRSGEQVLDLGCGTGALALRAARKGAKVKGIDPSAAMLEISAHRIREMGLEKSVELVEMGVAELDAEKEGQYDVLTGGLCLSELSEDELSFTLRQATRLLRPGGLLLIADETLPRGLLMRLLYRLLRAPLAILTYLITQQTTRPISNLEERIVESGLSIESIRRNLLGSFGEFVARKPEHRARRSRTT